ncbi:hypothetical protein G7046_g8291 [Stylonectria norvegica]|nr:hypothetical protein G7046_g8291 [Stylonectria norvegica]
MDDEEGGLFNIYISDASSDEGSKKEARRTGQTEEAFQAVKRDYRPKVENGEASSPSWAAFHHIYKTVKLPLDASASKQEVQEAVHAFEELYFFRQYEHALRFLRDVLRSSGGLDDETRQLLRTYEDKCLIKLKPMSDARASSA